MLAWWREGRVGPVSLDVFSLGTVQEGAFEQSTPRVAAGEARGRGRSPSSRRHCRRQGWGLGASPRWVWAKPKGSGPRSATGTQRTNREAGEEEEGGKAEGCPDERGSGALPPRRLELSEGGVETERAREGRTGAHGRKRPERSRLVSAAVPQALSGTIEFCERVGPGRACPVLPGTALSERPLFREAGRVFCCLETSELQFGARLPRIKLSEYEATS